MTPREIDALVASKVMGLTKNKHKEWCDGGGAILLPHYSTDIRAAWEVVEKIKSLDRGIRIHFNYSQWHVDFFHEDFWEFDNGADSAPMAICLAALKAKGVEIK